MIQSDQVLETSFIKKWFLFFLNLLLYWGEILEHPKAQWLQSMKFGILNNFIKIIPNLSEVFRGLKQPPELW